MNLFKLIGLNLVIKVSYFLVFILISKFININLSAVIEMLYSTARTISNISNAGVSVYLLKNKKFDIQILTHLLLQLFIVFIIYILIINIHFNTMYSYYIYLIPLIITLSPYIYYYQLGHKPLTASLYKEYHVYPLLVFFLLSFMIPSDYYSITLNILFSVSLLNILHKIYFIFKNININFNFTRLVRIYKESFIYVYSSLFIMVMNLDRLLFTTIFGVQNTKIYFSFILLLVPFILIGQLIEDYLISKKHTIEINIYHIAFVAVIFYYISLSSFAYGVYQGIFLYFNLIPVSSFIFSFVLVLVPIEIVKRIFYVNIVLENRYKILKYYGHIMNIFVFSIFAILYYTHIDNINYFFYSILLIYFVKNILLILLYKIQKRKLL